MNKKLNSRKLNLRPLTKSEKTLLTLLGIAVVVYFSNRFILTPDRKSVV